jgi:hypothetical protein
LKLWIPSGLSCTRSVPKAKLGNAGGPKTFFGHVLDCSYCGGPNSAMREDRSKASSASSGFECDVISIDDMQMNAFIRSDGCNSIEIEIDDPLSPTCTNDPKKSVEKCNKWYSEPDSINFNKSIILHEYFASEKSKELSSKVTLFPGISN